MSKPPYGKTLEIRRPDLAPPRLSHLWFIARMAFSPHRVRSLLRVLEGKFLASEPVHSDGGTLFVRLDELGDLAMTVPVLRTLTEQEVPYSILVRRKNADLAKEWLGGHRVIVFEDLCEPGPLLELRAAWKAAALGPYGRTVLLSHHLPLLTSLVLRRVSGVQIRPRERTFDRSGLAHELSIVESEVGFPATYFKASHRCRAPLVVVQAASRNPLRRWDTTKTRQFIMSMLDVGFRVALVGSGGERPIAVEICEGLPDTVENLCGQTSLLQLLTLVREAQLVVGVDSGVVHVAAIEGVPNVSLFGPQAVERWHPIGDNSVAVSARRWCSPCSQSACPYRPGERCMDDIDLDTVIRASGLALGQSFPPQ